MSRFAPREMMYKSREAYPEFGVYNIDVVPRGYPVIFAQADNWLEIIAMDLLELFANPVRGYVVSVLYQRPHRVFSWPRFVCFEYRPTVESANERAIELEEAASRGELVGLPSLGWGRRRALIRAGRKEMGEV